MDLERDDACTVTNRIETQCLPVKGQSRRICAIVSRRLASSSKSTAAAVAWVEDEGGEHSDPNLHANAHPIQREGKIYCPDLVRPHTG